MSIFLPKSLCRIIPILLIVFSLSSCKKSTSSDIQPGDTIHLMVMSTTDLHGWVLPFDYSRNEINEKFGLAKVATIVDSLRAIYPHTLLLDAGDFLQGNALADYFAKVDSSDRNYPLLSAIDQMHYDAMVIGNHEFNFGLDYLNRRVEMTQTPILGANVMKFGTNESAFPPYIIKDMHGVKVGILGLTTPGSMIWDQKNLDGKIEIKAASEIATSLVKELKELGCHIIIALAHSGYENNSSYSDEEISPENFGEYLATELEGIDLVILGHSHSVVDKVIKREDGTTVPVIQAGRWGDHLATALITIEYSREQGRILKVGEEINIIPSIDFSVNENIFKLVEEAHEEVISYSQAPLVYTQEVWSMENATLTDAPLVDLIQNAMLAYADADISAASIFNRNARIDTGWIKRMDLNAIYPYENKLIVLEVTGEIIKKYLEQAVSLYTISAGKIGISNRAPLYNLDFIEGINYRVDAKNPEGKRITNLIYQDKAVAPTDTFKMAINSYRAAGGGGFSLLQDAKVLYESEISIREMLEAYLLQKDTLRIKEESNVNWQLVK